MQEVINGIAGISCIAMLGLTFRIYSVVRKDLGNKIAREECHTAQIAVKDKIDALERSFNKRFDSFDQRITDLIKLLSK